MTQPHNKTTNERKKRIAEYVGWFFFLSSLAAGIHCVEIWHAPTASGFDVFLFFYAFIAFGISVFIWESVSFDPDETTGFWKWWW